MQYRSPMTRKQYPIAEPNSLTKLLRSLEDKAGCDTNAASCRTEAEVRSGIESQSGNRPNETQGLYSLARLKG